MDLRKLIPRRTVLIYSSVYAVVICAGILLSDRLLDAFVSGPDSFTRYVFKGLLIVVITAPFLFALLHRQPLTALKIYAARERSDLLLPVAAVMALSLAIAVVGFVGYHSVKNSVTHAVAANLQAVAELKVNQIDWWVENEMEDFDQVLKPAIDKPQFADTLVKWLRGGIHDEERRQKLVDYLRHLASTEHYLDISVHAVEDGALLLTSDGKADTASIRAFAVAAAHAGKPLLEDIHIEETSGTPKVHIGFYNVMRVGESDSVVVHITRDASAILFPMIQQWSGWTNSAEILLLRREGGDVVLLNTLRHQPDTPLKQRLAVSRPNSIGAAAVSGVNGMLHGNGFSEAPVFAYALPVKGTPWFLVAEMEEAEAYAKLNTVAALTSVIVAILMLACGWWLVEHNRKIMVMSRYRMERAEHMRRFGELSRRLVAVQEMERRRLSSELHDHIGANLAAINLNLKSIAAALPAKPSPSTDFLLAETSTLITDTIVSIREFCVDLRPVILDSAGLVPALDELLHKFGRRTGALVKLRSENMDGYLSKELELLLFRITQEALTNCTKHSNAKTVEVELACVDHKTILTITDDGVGFDPDVSGKGEYPAGLGLLNMRERAEFAGGKFVVISHPGRGTQIKVELDYRVLHAETQFDTSAPDKVAVTL